MPITNFSLHDLGWRDFQQLAHTILREVLGQTTVSFLDNNDGGRDGAFTGQWSPTKLESYKGVFVLQCKHTATKGHNLSLSDITDELAKIRSLASSIRPDVYILLTNAGITGQSERKIVDAIRACGIKSVLTLGSTWLNQTISEQPRLRRLVPRLYGLGDLTQILDERTYAQASSVLHSMRSELAKLVITGTHTKAAQALEKHRFVLLLGAPATGKTVTAAQLALGAADEFQTSVCKIESISELDRAWNPNERQLFWIDDAFGATQFELTAAHSWVRAQSKIKAALESGSAFIATSRNYVFKQAQPHLKPGTFPLLNEAQVVVDVQALTTTEREQILYNHLRRGRQPNSFILKLTPHLTRMIHQGAADVVLV